MATGIGTLGTRNVLIDGESRVENAHVFVPFDALTRERIMRGEICATIRRRRIAYAGDTFQVEGNELFQFVSIDYLPLWMAAEQYAALGFRSKQDLMDWFLGNFMGTEETFVYLYFFKNIESDPVMDTEVLGASESGEWL